MCVSADSKQPCLSAQEVEVAKTPKDNNKANSEQWWDGEVEILLI